MKRNQSPKKVTEMHFDALTLVKSQYAGKSHVPVNPAAEIVGVKSATVDEALANLQPAPIQAALELLGIAQKSETAGDSAEDAVDQYVKSAALSAFYSALYSLEYDCASVLNAPGFDSDARRAAIALLLSNFQEQITELSSMLFAEKAMATEQAVKAGARHSKDDKADIQAAHDKIGKAKDALEKAHEATTRLLADKKSDGEKPDDEKPGDKGDSTGEKSGVENPLENEVDEATKAAIIEEARNSALAEIQTAVKSAVAEAVAPLNEKLEAQSTELTATKSALDESKTALEAAKSEIEKLTTANKAMESQIATVVGESRERQTPGGHTDPTEIGKKGGEAVDTTAQTRDEIAKNPNMTLANAIGMILHGKKD